MSKVLLLLTLGALGSSMPTEPPRAMPATGGWISSDDYPADARRAGQEGVVAVKLFVDETGHVAACTITQSSNTPSLDAGTCALLTRRARFVPRAITPGAQFAGVYSTKVRWVLPIGDDELCPATLADANRLIASHSVVASRENDRGTITRDHTGGGTRLLAPVQKIQATIIDGQIFTLDFYLPSKAASHMSAFKNGYAAKKTKCTDSSCWWFEDEAHWHDPGVLANVDLQDMGSDPWSHLICHYEGYTQ